MNSVHALLVHAHISVGSIALILFWVPALARKGSRLHVLAGKLYVLTMSAVSITAFVASVIVLIDPLGVRLPDAELSVEQAEALAMRYRMFSLFLLMLAVLVMTSLRHGILALRERLQPGSLAHPGHRALILSLGTLAVVVGAIGIAESQLLLVIFGSLALSGSIGMLRDGLTLNPVRRQLVFAHLNSLIGTGVAAYTAFFAFGGARLLGDLLPGQWQVIPWVTPAIIGSVVIVRLKGRYLRPAGVPSRARTPKSSGIQRA